MLNRLKELKVGEVSLVTRGANRKKFLIMKEDKMQEDILKTVLEADLEDEAKVDEVLKAANLDEKASNAVKGALRLLNAYKDELPKDIMKTLAGLAGYGYAAPAEKTKKQKDKDDEDEEEYGEKKKAKKAKKAKGNNNDEEEEEEEKKAKKAKAEEEEEEEEKKKAACKDKDKYGGPVKKADGTYDFSGVPPEVRATVETLFKEHEAAVKKADELEKVLKAEQDRRVTAEYVERAKAYSHLPVNAPEFGPVLKALSEAAPEAYTKLEVVLKAADENLRTAEAFKPLGRDGGVGGGSAWDRIEALAKQRVQTVLKADGAKLSLQKAVDLVCQEQPDLYQVYLKEQKTARAQ